jgi:hypothetical protein
MSSGNGSGASLDLLKCLSLSEVIQKKQVLENGRKNLDDRQGLLERQKDDMLNINKVFRNWLTHLQKVTVFENFKESWQTRVCTTPVPRSNENKSRMRADCIYHYAVAKTFVIFQQNLSQLVQLKVD